MAFGNDRVRIGSGPINYYTEATMTNLYVEYSFGGNVNNITITNDSSSDTVQVSYDGTTLEGDLKHGETMTFNVQSKTSVYLKGDAGGDDIRIWGW
jgi:hypothetical protein